MPRFHNIDAYLASDHLPAWMRQRMIEIRQIIHTYPEIKELIRYDFPFFEYHGMLLFLGPFQKKRLTLRFYNAFQMTDKFGLLRADQGQTQIKHFEIFHNQEINYEILIWYLEEAMRVNAAIYHQKNAGRNKKSNRS